MESLQLNGKQLKNEQAIRSKIITAKGTLAPSIHLQWVTDMNYSETVLTLNHPSAAEAIGSGEYRADRLKRNGISVPDGRSTLLKQYITAVFQTRVLVLYRSNTRRIWLAHGKGQHREMYRRVSLQENTREARRVKETAIRAVYAAGLDYGVVKLALQPGNVITVLNVNPSPRLNPEMESGFISAIHQYIHRLPLMAADWNQVMLGADPEFIMRRKKGQVVMASEYFPRFGRVGCDAIWYGQNRSLKPLVELRPRPSIEPRQLVIRMYQGMIQAAKKVNDSSVQWLSGALPHPGFPLGGHIHFSGIPLNFKLLRALDNYLALPLILIEDPRGVRRRPKYGFLGDFRRQSHGGFEYRTLPSWLISPTLTKGVLAVAKLVASRYPYLTLDPLSDDDIQEAYYRGEKEKLRESVRQLWGELMTLREYGKYKIYLDALYEMLFSRSTWDESRDFRVLWKLPFRES
ncbi:putative amidoligase domain-containing protein [Paludifilum halophilum]|nr:hypothetical protein [Paludifilum halophilum]